MAINNSFEVISKIEEVRIIEHLSTSISKKSVYLVLDYTDENSGIRSFQTFEVLEPSEDLNFYRKLLQQEVELSGYFLLDDSFDEKIEFLVTNIKLVNKDASRT